MSGFDEPLAVDLPVGRRLAYRFDSPDEILLRCQLGLDVEFRVALEWSLASRVMSLLRRRSVTAPRRSGLGRWLALLAAPLGWLGTDVGCLQVEVVGRAGSSVQATLTDRGQRLAVLPCVRALDVLLGAGPPPRGCVVPASWLPPEDSIDWLAARGIRFEWR